ncbi:MAG: hypothetical protein OXH31_05665 [Gammaproteobacteria bacterium]|nr:hypothetical protein [Gammaproteobacteria bacterium]
MLFESLVQDAPEQAVSAASDFESHRRQILIRNIFSQWSSINLESALAAISKLQKTERTIALDTIIATRMDLPSAELSSIASRLNFETDLLEWQQDQSIHELANGVPMNAIELLVNDEVDDVQQLDLYLEIVEKWFQVDGLGILTELQRANLDGEIFAELFDYITGRDRAAALNFLTGVGWSTNNHLGPRSINPWLDENVEETLSRLATRLINTWLDENAEEAFDAVKSLPKSRFRTYMLEKLIEAWSSKAPSVVLDRLMDIPRVVRADALTISASKLAIDNPTDALVRITSLSLVPGVNVHRATLMVIRTWSSEAPALALDWIQTNEEQGSRERAEMIAELLWKYSLEDPEHAMALAVEESLPAGSGIDADNMRRTVINTLVHNDRIDTAIEFLDQVPDEDRRRLSTDIGRVLMREGQIDQVLELSEQLSEEDQFHYFFSTLGFSLYEQAQPTSKLLELLEKIPSSDLQSNVARMFITSYPERFNADQLETLKSYFSD